MTNISPQAEVTDTGCTPWSCVHIFRVTSDVTWACCVYVHTFQKESSGLKWNAVFWRWCLRKTCRSDSVFHSQSTTQSPTTTQSKHTLDFFANYKSKTGTVKLCRSPDRLSAWQLSSSTLYVTWLTSALSLTLANTLPTWGCYLVQFI